MRKTIRTRFLILVLPLTALLALGCPPPPPNLTPQGLRAFQATRVITALDQLRDTAIAANAQVPPLISTATTRVIVTYHKAALLTIQSDTSNGWVVAVKTGLDQVVATLPPKEATVVAPYVTLVETILTAVTQ